MNTPKWTIAEFAELKGINVKTLRNKIAKNKIKLDGVRQRDMDSTFVARSRSSSAKQRYELSYLEKMLKAVI